ncbi:MAG: Rv1157c family protein [Mycobacteriaceae bacterium]|uniref:Rv1157c family protein n=1 Tax=Corynebacterium sp. TaxID=1720 RepID=UPI003F9D3ED4
MRRAALAALTAASVATGTALAAAPAAQAQPALPGLPALPIDELGRPNPEILAQIENFANSPQVPDDIGDTLMRVVGFFRGDGEPGVPLPENGPGFTQFGWPAPSTGCVGSDGTPIGMGMGVPGPADLPLPGVPGGHTSFVFTALGTGPLSENQGNGMRVHWVNIDNGRTGQTPLKNGGINAEGPGTVNGLANTGRGNVVAVLEGAVSTDEDSGRVSCSYIPTAGVFNVR